MNRVDWRGRTMAKRPERHLVTGLHEATEPFCLAQDIELFRGSRSTEHSDDGPCRITVPQ